MAKFPRQNRLLKSCEFDAVFQKRRALRAENVALHYFFTPNENARLGIIAPKKGLKRAVERNRFKRIAREVFRQMELPAVDVILRFTPKKARLLESQKTPLALELRALFARLKNL